MTYEEFVKRWEELEDDFEVADSYYDDSYLIETYELLDDIRRKADMMANQLEVEKEYV